MLRGDEARCNEHNSTAIGRQIAKRIERNTKVPRIPVWYVVLQVNEWEGNSDLIYVETELSRLKCRRTVIVRRKMIVMLNYKTSKFDVLGNNFMSLDRKNERP